MNLRITLFVSSDQAAVKQFIIDVWKEFGFNYHKEYDRDLDDIQSFYMNLGGMFLILKQDKNIIGTIAVIKKTDVIAELKRLYVAKNYRGNGYGSALVDKANMYCKECGFKKIILETNKKFIIAHELYQKHGFSLTHEDSRSYYMEKIL